MHSHSLPRSWVDSITAGLRPYALVAATIAAAYLLLGGAWILLSDQLLLFLFRDPDTMTQFQTYKGWAFILVTASLLFGLIWRNTAKIVRSQERESRLRRQVERTAIETATLPARTIAAKDGYTGDHCDRIAGRSQKLGRKLGLT